MKRSIILGLSVIIILTAFTACSSEKNDESIITQSVSEESTQTAEESTVNEEDEVTVSHTPGEFNIDDAVNDIVIDGKKYKVPTTLKEMGESYTTDLASEALFIPEAWGKCTTSVVYDNDKPVMSVFTQRGKNDKVGENDEIFCIAALSAKNIGLSTVYGLSVGDKIDKMIELWGDPIETENAKSYTNYYYGGAKDDLRYVEVMVKDGYVEYIEVLNKR